MSGVRKTVLAMETSACCGCGACEAICPVNAIKMCLDKDGFYYPVKTDMDCISCYLCIKVCGANTEGDLCRTPGTLEGEL